MSGTNGLSGPTTKRPKVLVVDDDPALLTTVGAILEDDYDVVTASSAADAMEKFSSTRFDAVASDFLMPQMNGLELLTEMARSRPELVSVLMTGYRDFAQRAEARERQRPTYFLVTKPFHPGLLLSALDRAISLTRLKHQAAQLAGRETAKPQHPDPAEPPPQEATVRSGD